MDFFNVLTMIGGLALFLYGMNMLGEGLEKASGGKLEKILEKLTSNPFKAVLLGLSITAVIQSSSATTVMVVGFVNSGIMSLSQTIGIIMGANIGTTVTAWILSLTGIQSTNFFLRMLKPTSFSPILAIIGVSFVLFSKKQKKKDIGLIMVGFAVLMFGMETMSTAMKPLADMPEFVDILVLFSNPVLGVLAGALFTAMIQSSSASVGVLQALCNTGTIRFGTALPIIMGQNIGTCITALLSSIGANKNAKRAALIHLYFNLIGTIVFMAVFYSINALLKFAFLDKFANAAGIAVVHTIFNVATTFILLPFAKGLEKLAYLTIKETEEEILEKQQSMEQRESEFNVQILEPRFLETPSFAVEQCRNATSRMADLSKETFFTAMQTIMQYSEKREKKVMKLEKLVDRYEDEINNYLVKLSSKNLSEKDSRSISILLHCIRDFERISDHAVNVLEVVKEMQKREIVFSKKAEAELKIFGEAMCDILDRSMAVFEEENLDLANTVEPLEEVIDDLSVEIRKRHMKRLRKGKCSIEAGFLLSDIITNYERVADHCSNIAVCILQITEEDFEPHEYLDSMRREDNTGFKILYEKYKESYKLS